MVAQTRTGPALQSLKFKEKLLTKAQSSDALLKKLKVLHAELASLDQETTDTRSLSTISRDLIHQSVFLHRDKGVKAYAACCMADMLRLYAPDAPYTALELKDMFQFFFRQLATGLKSQDAPWFSEYVYILESMATIKTVCLVPDLPHGDDLTLEIFRDFFELVKNDLSKKVELFMSEILISLIDESPSVPSAVLDILLGQFTAKTARKDHPTHRLAVDVCKATSDKLHGPVAQYFTDIIVQHPSDDDDEVETDDVQAAHELIIQIHRSAPALLNNVIPQLGEELQVDNVHLRTLATQTLGSMFSYDSSIASKYPSAWKTWITRGRDKSAVVRVTFVEALKGLLLKHNALSEEVEQALAAKMHDGDDKVRTAVCKVYASLDYESALHRVSVEQWKQLAERMLDRKPAVRQEAFNALGKLYRLANPEIEANDHSAVEHFSWIPGQIIQAATSTDVDLKTAAEQALSKYVLPLPTKGDDEVAWTEQFLVVAKHLEPQRLTALITLSNISLPRPSFLERYVQCCIAYNAGIIDEDEKKVTSAYNGIITQISRRFFHDHVKAADDLQAFGKLNESRMYKLMQASMDPHVDLKTLVKSLTDLSKRLEQAASSIHSTMMDLLRRHTLNIINTSSIPTLVKRIQRQDKNDPDGARASREILVALAKQCPAVFKTHVAEFSRALAEEGNVPLIEVSLQALAAVSRWDSSCAPTDKRVLDRVERFARSNNPNYAKFATRLLAHSKKKDELCSRLAEETGADIDTQEDEMLEARLRVFAELAKSAPDAFETSSDKVIRFLLRDVMTLVPDAADDTEEWDESLPLPYAARLKILSLKICVNRALSHADLTTSTEVFTPIMKMLFAIIQNQGTIKPDLTDHAQIKAVLRLRAATYLLKLSTNRKFSPAITTQFLPLVITIQDPSYQVRLGFLNKLVFYLKSMMLDPRYNMALFLSALDPEEEVKNKAAMYVKWFMTRTPPEVRLAQLEKPLPRLLHLLAIHPDFSLEVEALKDFGDYLNMYMDHVLTSENIHLLTFLAQKTKSVRVNDSHGMSENLYALSELAQHKIRQRAVKHGWATNAYPGQVVLPSDIFKALPSAEVAHKIQRTVYLSEEKIAAIDEPVQKPKPRKRAVKRKPTSSKPRGRKRKPAHSDDDDDEDDDEDEESSDDGGREDPDDPIEDEDEGDKHTVHATSSDVGEDIDMEAGSDNDEEKPRRNAPRSARPRASKKKRVS